MIQAELSVLPPLPPWIYGRRSASLPFPLREPGCTIFSRARHGLVAGLATLGFGPGDELLVPAYHHGSEVEALQRAGVRCRLYDVGENAAPDPDALDELMGPRVRGLYLIHYLGFPQDAPGWRAWCDARGLLLIEDAAQAWLATIDEHPAGSFGDLAIFCLYKTYGLPDGAALLTPTPTQPPRGARPVGLERLARRHGRWLAGRSGVVAAGRGKLRRPRGYSLTDDFELGDPTVRPSAATSFALPRVVGTDAAELRRRNYAALLAELGDLVPAAFAAPPPGASPHAFPVETDAPDELVRQLAQHGVRAFRFWSHPHPSVSPEQFPVATALRARLVVLPVHQELRSADLERVSEATRAAWPQRRLPDQSVAHTSR
jgi:dTDP-4-amino-4,6-dideoxygalactose transaminase